MISVTGRWKQRGSDMVYTADDSQFQVYDEQIPDLAGWHRFLE